MTTISSRISMAYAPTLIVALLQVIGSFTEFSPRTNARYSIATQLTNNSLGPLRPSSTPIVACSRLLPTSATAPSSSSHEWLVLAAVAVFHFRPSPAAECLVHAHVRHDCLNSPTFFYALLSRTSSQCM
ncbi:hypothetical protein DFH08DRAFT_840536 [Mycena albidolilacea]|uniref:Uncharacterized protein n=1 Tax=Mycena albidolilacea TaxID=1033008 RepID=A0AAD7F1S2_9AGAR|nr:hypothetical protein DFH08DRAFT_840536 [Mycena albidolilacea]